jgi:hypothetical protein
MSLAKYREITHQLFPRTRLSEPGSSKLETHRCSGRSQHPRPITTFPLSATPCAGPRALPRRSRSSSTVRHCSIRFSLESNRFSPFARSNEKRSLEPRLMNPTIVRLAQDQGVDAIRAVGPARSRLAWDLGYLDKG